MKITNKLGLPQPFISAVESDYIYTDKRYSVTQILKGVRELLLLRRHNDEIEQDVSDMIWLIFGNAVHSILENSQETDYQLKETSIYYTLPNGYTLSGRQDLYDEKLKRITDYKTGTVYKIIYNDWEDYRKQCLMYALIMKKLGFECDNADIVLILKDFSNTKSTFDSNYPDHPVYIKHFDFTDNDFKEIESFIDKRFEEIIKAESLTDEDLPLCTPEERWAKPTTFAIIKKGNKTATKVCSSIEEAESLINEKYGNAYEIVERPGKDAKCENYCSACKFCKYYQENYENEIKTE